MKLSDTLAHEVYDILAYGVYDALAHVVYDDLAYEDYDTLVHEIKDKKQLIFDFSINYIIFIPKRRSEEEKTILQLARASKD